MRGQTIGIDAGNTRSGGGLTYLSEMMNAADPKKSGVEHVVIWGNSAALAQMPERPWLVLRHQKEHDEFNAAGFFWQRRKLEGLARAEECDLLFFPGSTYLGDFHPYVAVSQNMLPFSPVERARFDIGWLRLRLRLLEYMQARTFRRADGMIFLTQWAKLGIESYLRSQYRRSRIVPHGISERFCRAIPVQKPASEFSMERPFRWLYVSIVSPYKHQWQVAEAAALLRNKGVPISVDFVGPAHPPSLTRLQATLTELDPMGKFLRYVGPVSYHELHAHYHGADAFVFATSCENLPNILIEAMSASLPIASSRMGPMPEVLGDGGLYFDPLSSENTAEVMLRLFRDHELRARCVRIATVRASAYSWGRCADETFSFLADVARKPRST
ncbi:MAG: hypothetical protein RL077_4301 [Verrucomicrobiota bacterium]|jgi:glycosyltransferase involved in cell wall biosynthesis